MKGIELPVNVLVIIAVAVLVMLALVAMYMAGTAGAGPMSVLAAKNSACGVLQNKMCNVDPKTVNVNYDADGNGKIAGGTSEQSDNLQVLCNVNFGCGDVKESGNNPSQWDGVNHTKCCKQSCGCSNIG